MKKTLSIISLSLLLQACSVLPPITTVLPIDVDAGAYTTGTEITQSQMDQLQVNKSTKSDVERLVGATADQSTRGGVTVWKYPFTKIRHVGKNVSETTVFEFNKKGILIKKYKANGASKSGDNPLVNAA